jgi:co-chaperonin GroES (HSP10)
VRLTVDHIAIKPLRKAERAVGKIVLPLASQAPFMMWGEVIAVGPGYRSEVTKTLWPTFAQPGDIILYPNGAARNSYENLRVDDRVHDQIVFVMERDAGLILRNGCVYPMYRRIIGHVLEQQTIEETSSGLILFNSDKRQSDHTTSYVHVKVDHVGFGQRADDATLIPNTVTPGDIVIADKFDAWEYELIAGDALTGHVILDEDQILAIDDDFVESSDAIKKQNEIIRQIMAAAR